MSMQRKAFGAQTETLADKRQVRVVCSTPEVDRAGDIVVQEGIDLSGYNGVVLWQHNPNCPVARCIEIGLQDGKLMAVVQFPPEGDDPEADLLYRRVKNEIVNCVSIGFIGRDLAAVDPAKPPKIDAAGNNTGGGVKYLTSELCEFSFVSIPAARGAVIVERSGMVSLPATELAALKAAAQLPAALATELRSAAAGLPLLSKAARGPLLRCALMAEGAVPGNVAVKAVPKLTGKSLWHVGYLASALSELGWVHGCVEGEADWTNSDSAVPAMLAEALRQIGAALVTLTQEEVAAMLAELADGDADEAAEAATDGDIAVKDLIGALHGKAIPALSIKAGRLRLDAGTSQPPANDTTGKALALKRARELDLLMVG